MAKPITEMTPEEFDEYCRAEHAEAHPTGCGSGVPGSVFGPSPCERCAQRCGYKPQPCPYCKKPITVVNGRFVNHDVKVGGRRFYKARNQECEGSRKKVR